MSSSPASVWPDRLHHHQHSAAPPPALLYKAGDGSAAVDNSSQSMSTSRTPPTGRFIRHSPHASSPPHFSAFLSTPTPRHSHTPSHPHITLQDVSHPQYPYHPSLPSTTSSSSPPSSHLPSHSRPDPNLSHTLTLPPTAHHHPHHRGGVKSHSADFYSSPSSSPSPSSSFPPSPSRTHSPRHNGVVHLSAAALEFSPTLTPTAVLSSPPRPSSQLSAAPTSPHSARSTSSTTSSTSSSSSSQHQPRALSRQSSHGRASTATTTSSLPSSSSLCTSAPSPSPPSSIPLQPCDDFDVTLNLSVEQPAHLPYLLSFRTSVCSHWASLGPAQCGCISATCFASHSTRPRRRRPTLLNGRYNYLPTRCRYVRGGGNGGAEAEDDCPQGVHCRFAHCTEEVIYHPSKYKTQLCQHRTDEDVACVGYGLHCAKAHSPSDLRVGVYEVSDDCPTPLYSATDHLHHFQCPQPDQSQERLYYAYRYKTKRCDGFPYNCSCNGFDYHREEERRRGPIILYAPIACPNVKPTPHSEWGYPAIDCSGRHRPRVLESGVWKVQRSEVWECDYAHTLLELMYHPAVYKTGQCDKWEEKEVRRWKCVWKRRCAHAHGRADARSKDEATEEWKDHIRTHVAASAVQATLARLLHAQGSNAANAGNGAAYHAASAPLPAIGDGEGGGMRAVLGHSRSVSQPMMDLQRGGAGAPLPAHLSSFSLRQVQPARSISQNVLPLPNGPPPPSASLTSMSGHDRLSPRPLRIIPTQPLTPSHPHSPTSATSTSLSLFKLRSTAADASSSLWSSPVPPLPTSASSPSPPADAAAVQSTASWTSSRSALKHHRRSVTADATTTINTSPSNLHSLFSTFPTHHPFPHPSLTLVMPSTVSSSSTSPPSSASPSHLVPKNLFSSTSSLQSSVGNSLVTSPKAGGGGGSMEGGGAGGVRVRLIPKQGMAGEEVEEVKAKGHRLIRCCEERERSGALPITFLRYLSCAETNDGVVVAHAEEGEAQLSVYSALQSSSSMLHPLPLIHRLFTAVSALHAESIEHGAISPFTLFLASTPTPHLRLGDVRWRRAAPGAREQERDDVFACACVAYFLLSSGRSPFSSSTSTPPLTHSDWMEGRLQYPVDTSCLSPLASQLLLPLLFSDSSSRLTAAQVTAQPLFWSPAHSLHFLYVLSYFLRPSMQPRGAVELPTSYIGVEEVQMFLLECARCEPRLTASNSWVDALHPVLRGLAVAKGCNGRSAVAALHFVVDCVDLLAGFSGTTVPCELHSLFDLPHSLHCQQPALGSADAVSACVRYQRASAACASYFLPLFPHLLPFLFQRVEARLMSEPTFQPFSSSEDGSRPFLRGDPARPASPRWKQLREMMQCPMRGRGTGGESGPHPLHRPVTLPCCGMALCAACLPDYSACVDGRPCQCGREVSERQRQLLHALPVNALLQAITALLPP